MKREKITKRKSLIVLITTLFVASTNVQDNQLWLDNFTMWTFSQRWEYELNIGGNYLLIENGWKDYYINNTLTHEYRWWCPSEASLELHYTNDPQEINSTEQRISLAQKMIFTKFMNVIHLEKPYIYGKYDYRVISYIDDYQTDIKQRVRLKVGGRFILNNTVVEAHSIYAPVAYEKFFNINDAAIEHFAAKDKFMVGLGYAFTNKLRSEFVYYLYRSKNTVENSYATTDVVYQLLLRYYIYEVNYNFK